MTEYINKLAEGKFPDNTIGIPGLFKRDRENYTSGFADGVEFMKWCANNDYIYVGNDNWFHTFDKAKTPTTTELLSLYIKQLEGEV